MQVTLKNYAKGLATFIPGLYKYSCSGTGGTISARYCYAVWMRHLIFLSRNNFPLSNLKKIAELGPGDTLGIGICALLCGVNEYYGLDIKAHSNSERNLEILSDLIDLFKKRESIPDDQEFPSLWPTLDDYAFPIDILSDEIMHKSLESSRLQNIRTALSFQSNENPIQITYIAPWENVNPILRKFSGFDLIFSQAVMEHVDQIELTYSALYKWLRVGGAMSHSIDYRSHGYTKDWNGHWLLSSLSWAALKGRRIYFINRLYHSEQVKSIRNSNFTVLQELKKYSESMLRRNELSPQFQNIPDDDLKISSAFIYAKKLTES